MARTYSQQEVGEDGLVPLTFRRIVGKNPDGSDMFEEDTYKLPAIYELEADLIDDLSTVGTGQWMAKMLNRHAPELARKLRFPQLAGVFRDYVNDPEVTPGESQPSSES